MSNESELPSITEEEYNATEVITITDLAAVFEVTRITAKSRLEKGEVEPVARLTRQGPGRPPKLFQRAAADRAMTAKRQNTDVVAQAVADALAE